MKTLKDINTPVTQARRLAAKQPHTKQRGRQTLRVKVTVLG